MREASIKILCLLWGALAVQGGLLAQAFDQRQDKKQSSAERLDELKSLIDSSMTQDLSRAAVYVAELKEMAERAGSGYHLGFAYEKQATLSYRSSQLDSARVQFKRAFDFYWQAGYRDEGVLAYIRIGVMYSLEGRFKDAARIYGNAKARSRDMTKARAYLYNQMGTLHHYQANADSAEHYYAKSVEIYRAIKDTVEMMRPMYNYAVLLVDNNKTGEAKRILFDLKEFQEELGLDATLTYGLIGGVAMSEGDFEKARMYAEKQYDYAAATKDTVKMMIALENLGELVLGSGEPSSSIPYFEASLAISKKGGMWEEQQIALQGLGRAYLAMKQYDSAEDYFNASLALSANQEESRYAPGTMGYMGQLYYQTGRLEEAMQWAEKALATRKDNLSNTDVAMIYSTMANIHLANRQPRLAIALGEKGYDLLSGGDSDVSWKMEMAHTLYLAQKEIGNYEASLRYHEQYKAMSDTLYNVEKAREQAKQLKDFEFEREKESLAFQQKAREDLLQAKARQNALIAGGVGLFALASLFFFMNSRRQKAQISLKNEELTQLNTTKDRIFAIIGHDLRKPALAFRGMTQKINYLLRVKDYQRLTALGKQLEESAYALNAVTDNLLNWALLQKNIVGYQPTIVPLSQVAEQLHATFDTAAQNKHIALGIFKDVSPQLHVFADPTALRTILRNLIENAIKYTPDGGFVDVTAASEGDSTIIAVLDSGTGISDEDRKGLFLLQVHKSRPGTAGEKGTGLGLYLAHELAKINKGVLTLNAKVTKGACFELQLPASSH